MQCEGEIMHTLRMSSGDNLQQAQISISSSP